MTLLQGFWNGREFQPHDLRKMLKKVPETFLLRYSTVTLLWYHGLFYMFKDITDTEFEWLKKEHTELSIRIPKKYNYIPFEHLILPIQLRHGFAKYPHATEIVVTEKDRLKLPYKSEYRNGTVFTSDQRCMIETEHYYVFCSIRFDKELNETGDNFMIEQSLSFDWMKK